MLVILILGLLWLAFGAYHIIDYFIHLGILTRNDIPNAKKHYKWHGLGLVLYFILLRFFTHIDLLQNLVIIHLFLVPWVFVIHWYLIKRELKKKVEIEEVIDDALLF